MPIQKITVAEDEIDTRLDRLVRRHFPQLKQGQIEKLVRTGQLRIDGKRTKSAYRVEPGQVIRLPLFDNSTGDAEQKGEATKAERPISQADADYIRSMVLYEDDDVIALNKPSGLAVQGGTRTLQHVDGLLDALAVGKERPRLVHRLDKDTSGILLIARTAFAAAQLSKSFRSHKAHKLYWALVSGVPRIEAGTIDSRIQKKERGSDFQDPEAAKRAVTHYAMVTNIAQQYAWLALSPVTGRTHQLRIHCAEIEHPVVGDEKYGFKREDLQSEGNGNIERKLHLHARSIVCPHPRGGRLNIDAPLTGHMERTWRFLELDQDDWQFAHERIEELWD